MNGRAVRFGAVLGILGVLGWMACVVVDRVAAGDTGGAIRLGLLVFCIVVLVAAKR